MSEPKGYREAANHLHYIEDATMSWRFDGLSPECVVTSIDVYAPPRTFTLYDPETSRVRVMTSDALDRIRPWRADYLEVE